jgi:uncharacterized membrane protein
MSKLAIPITALAICYVIFFSYLWSTYTTLPAQVATHFNTAGKPNGWMSRDACIAFTIGIGILMPAFMVGMMAGAARLPISFLNVPHRDYWQEPERRRQAVAILLHFSLWFACMNVLFVTGMHGLILQANAPGQNAHLNPAGLSLVSGGFLAGTIIWVALLVRRFTKIT